MTPRPDPIVSRRVPRARSLALVAGLALAAGCHCPLPGRRAKPGDKATAAKAAATTAGQTAAATAPGSAPTADPAPGTGPWDQLATLDGRKPVPLLPVMALHQKNEMQGHLAAIQGILAGLAAHDFDAVARSAKAIGSSPRWP